MIQNHDVLESEKCASMVGFNALRNNRLYFKVKITNNHLNSECNDWVLDKDMENLLNSLEKANEINLQLGERNWKMDIVWSGLGCRFGNGWNDFSRETSLSPGDMLVLYQCVFDNSLVNVCIFKNIVINGTETYAESGNTSRKGSFYKCVSPTSIAGGFIVVPMLFHAEYENELKNIEWIRTEEFVWEIGFDSSSGQISGLDDMMRRFRLKNKHTMIFSFNGERLLDARIYESDGMEMEYSKVLNGTVETDHTGWFISIEWSWDLEEFAVKTVAEPGDNLIETNMVNEDDAEFRVTLNKSHVDKNSHGVIIPKHISPKQRGWKDGEEVILRIDVLDWTTTLVVNLGRARFSTGWNAFVRDNELAVDDILVFKMMEDDKGVSFDIGFGR